MPRHGNINHDRARLSIGGETSRFNGCARVRDSGESNLKRAVKVAGFNEVLFLGISTCRDCILCASELYEFCKSYLAESI